MKKKIIILTVVLLVLAATCAHATKYYRTDNGRYEEAESSYMVKYDFRQLHKKFNAANEHGKVAIIKTVFRDSWILEAFQRDEKDQSWRLIDSRGAFDNGTLREQDLLSLSEESRLQLLLAAEEIISSEKLWWDETSKRMKIFALWVKDAKSIGREKELKSFVKDYLSQRTDIKDDVIACYLAYCGLSDDEFDQITTSIISDIRSRLNHLESGYYSSYPVTVEHQALIREIAEQNLLPEKNMSSLVNVLGEYFAKILPYFLEPIMKEVKPHINWCPPTYKRVGYKLGAVEANCEIAKTLKIISQRYQTLSAKIDEMLKKDITRRKSYNRDSSKDPRGGFRR